MTLERLEEIKKSSDTIRECSIEDMDELLEEILRQRALIQDFYILGNQRSIRTEVDSWRKE